LRHSFSVGAAKANPHCSVFALWRNTSTHADAHFKVQTIKSFDPFRLDFRLLLGGQKHRKPTFAAFPIVYDSINSKLFKRQAQ
jgi:hypothetical protein